MNQFFFRLQNSCGVCIQSMKTRQGMAIYRAKCSHTFCFSCIAAHVRKQNILICPICKSLWKDVPLLAIHKLQWQNHQEDQQEKEIAVNCNTEKFKSPQNAQFPNLKTNLELPVPQIKQHFDYSKTNNDEDPLHSAPVGAKFILIPIENKEREGDEKKRRSWKSSRILCESNSKWRSFFWRIFQ